jgi:predicted DsbA family dithiol-disulfide isomerase
MGVTVTALPYELHPEIPVGGISLEERWGSRYREAKGMYARIEAEAEAAGLPFSRPARVPNTRRALKTAEWVRRNQPDVFPALDRSLFETHFVENRPLDDPDVLDELVAAADGDASAARTAVEAGELDGALRDSMDAAMDANVTGTPAWLLDGKLLVPGVQPRELFEIWVTRLRERSGS